MHRRFAAFVVPALVAAAAAQGSVAPVGLTPTVDLGPLTPAALQVAQVQSICAIRLPGDPPGTWYLGLTVTGLPAARGGAGSNDVLTGRFDAAGTFTEDGAAAAINTSGGEFAMSLHASGLLAVTDDYASAGVKLSTRPNVNAPFTVAGLIQGLPPQSWYDAALATIDGQLFLLATIAGDIAAMPLDTTTRTVGPAVVIARASGAQRAANSAQPIVDGNGEMVALSFHDLEALAFADNDQWIAADLDPSTPPLRVVDSNEFYSNGTYFGGRYVAALSNTAGYRMVAYDTVMCGGGRAAVGGSMSVLAHAPANAGQSWLGFLLVSPGFIGPVQLPFAQGALGVDPVGLLVVPLGPHDPFSGIAAVALPVPGAGNLAGRRVPAQSVAVEVIGSTIAFGNTCALTIR